MSVIELFSDPGRIAVMIPIVAVVTFGAVAIVNAVIKHRERMAMIEMGIHPDHPALDEEPADVRETQAPSV